MTNFIDGELRRRVGHRIKALRESKCLKRRHVAQSLGHEYQWLWDIESGRRWPTMPDTYALAELFDVSLNELLGDPDHVAAK